MTSYPKLVALDTDWTLWWGWLDMNKWGKGNGAYSPPEDNIEYDSGSDKVLRDRSNHNEKIWLYGKVPDIITDIVKHGAKLAIVSRNRSKGASDRALWYFNAVDPRDGKKKPIIDMVDFDEVVDEDKTKHFERIKGWTGFDFSDMILFDDEAVNNLVRVVQGVTFQVSRDQQGLTWENYQQGLDTWRRLQKIRSPYLGQSLQSYSNPVFLGYSGMDEDTVNRLTSGGHRVDLTESARWGYAMYVADDIRIAHYFSEWIKRDAFGPNAKTYVWFTETNSLMNNVHSQSAFQIAWDQENRDVQAAKWYAPPPYILFSRHGRMGDMPNNIPRGRFNEMVVYTQLQDALILTIPLTNQQIANKMYSSPKSAPFEHQFKNWRIRMSLEMFAEFKGQGEPWS
ncbi:hypothetical protein CONPUDRAFT_72203 [Coniophora puteana RWD-64-598 SS2]|uniref:Uncharacterized protein n=1 Tax=Coniophora puteana (strain RWD-64-598) TaxID=741705 RepID=A0A5M3MRW9_CONPW|nr:uncharacterized protein CONPUDRAFT_72203 [Coniophora puteana RWD-64-598 SS2]EIW81817.1 hypothetical protein CONPUDRAFT_72203 [Coniophora puteana RWD-64-598 SS2]